MLLLWLFYCSTLIILSRFGYCGGTAVFAQFLKSVTTVVVVLQFLHIILINVATMAVVL